MPEWLKLLVDFSLLFLSCWNQIAGLRAAPIDYGRVTYGVVLLLLMSH